MENVAGLGLLHAGIKNWETASILHLGIIFNIILKQDKGTGRFLISCLLGGCPTEDDCFQKDIRRFGCKVNDYGRTKAS